MYEVFELLLKKYGITTYKFCKDTGVNSSTISTWKKKKSLVGSEIGKIICNYFGITMDYLLTGKDEIPQKDSKIALKDECEIGYDLDKIREKLEKDVNGPFFYKGKPLDDESIELLVKTLEIGLAHLERDTKKK